MNPDSSMTDCIKTDPEAIDFRQLMLSEPYDFLRTDEHLGRRIALLGLGGSHAYGTNNENSDVDFRGIALQSPSDLIGLTTFEQYEDRKTDTVIYGFNKMVRLLLQCNPNTIELLGLDEDQYLICTEIGREILEHKSLFLSKRAARSFGGYASAQLRRLQNAIARDSVPQQERERHIMNSVKNAWEDVQQKCRAFDRGTLRIYIDQAENPQLETEIFIDADYKHLPLRDYKDMLVSMNNVIREYDKIGKRNHKKDDDHLNKHAMHLIRLYMMAIDILEKGEIRTHRTQAGDLDLLLSIRRGEFMSEPGVLSDDFYRILSEYEAKMERAIRVSRLPDEPDMEQVAAFVESVNRQALCFDR
ncbi:MAG: nucleotidyltransferase domain-containing protein [Lachnospiraceae bacterium]|nr:nucleotidyltransferase domain-containing protein [Lachnospiraceae bacterium]